MTDVRAKSSRSYLLLASLVFIAVSFISTTMAAFSQLPIGITDGFLMNQGQSAANELKRYYSKHGHLPQNNDEVDAALKDIYRAVNGGDPDQHTLVSTSENYRTLGTLRMAVDPTIMNAPVQQWRVNPPDNWNAPANNIVMLVDGNGSYLVWVAAISGNPIRDSNNRAMFYYGQLGKAEASSQ